MIRKYVPHSLTLASFFNWKPAFVIHAVFSIIAAKWYFGPLSFYNYFTVVFMGSSHLGMGLIFMHMFHSAWLKGEVKNVLRDYRTYIVAGIPASCLTYWIFLLFPHRESKESTFQAIEWTYVSIWIFAALISFRMSEKIIPLEKNSL